MTSLEHLLLQSDQRILDEALMSFEREERRRLASRELIAFTEWTFPRYQTGPIHRKIAEQLERIEKGEIDRLMLLVPPRHGKSELASRRFPAFFLGRHPHKQFISASASAPLAEDFGRDVRNILLSEEYQQIFDTRLSEDSQAKGRWNTQQGGSYYAVGVKSNVMGRGAHVFLIDDPFGSMADARSELERKNVFEWFTGTVYNRLEEKGAVVVINHRMHEDDLTGRLLAQQAAGGDQWTVVELAIDEHCTPLWPEKYDREALERIRRNTLPMDWSALYRQNPVPDSGIFFQRDWLRSYVHPPARETIVVYGASDYATKDGEGDYTVHLVVGIDPEERIWLLDLWRAQATADVWVQAWCDMVRQWKPSGWAEEKGQINNAVGPFLEKRARETRAYVARAGFTSRVSKRERARSIQGRMAMNGLYVPSTAPWYPDFEAELLAFDVGRHDDQCDALGLIGQVLDRMIPGRHPKIAEPERILSTDPAINTATLNDVWEDHERKAKRWAMGVSRIK